MSLVRNLSHKNKNSSCEANIVKVSVNYFDDGKYEVQTIFYVIALWIQWQSIKKALLMATKELVGGN